MFRVSDTPSFNFLCDDMLTRDPARIAAHLGVTVKTLQRWQDSDQAPRTALLALFYESRWGYSLLATTSHNEALYARQEVAGLQRENAMLRTRIARLESLGDFGAANAPLLGATAPAVITQSGIGVDEVAQRRDL